MMSTNSAPRVSVVVPFLDPGEFLRDAIESVRSQTFGSWELILVDDGSSDCSVQIARDYASTYPEQVVYLQHPDGKNRGISASRNLGDSRARGEFIARLDADDVFVADKLERQVAILDGHPQVAMTFGPMLVWSSWQGGEDELQPLNFDVDKVLQPPTFIPLLLSGKNDPAGCLIRRTAIERTAGYVDHISMCEDWVLYVKIAMTFDIFVESRCGYYYRKHQNQSCSVRHDAGRFHAEFRPFFDWLDGYLKSIGCKDVEVQRAYVRAVRQNRINRVEEGLRKLARVAIFRNRPHLKSS